MLCIIQRLITDLVSAAASAQSIATGSGYTCVILSSWFTECWGANKYGQLGSGNRSDALDPSPLDLRTGMEPPMASKK